MKCFFENSAASIKYISKVKVSRDRPRCPKGFRIG